MLTRAEPLDSIVLQLEFDGYLDPDAPLSAADVRIIALADSTPVAIDTLLHAWQFEIWRDSVAAAEQARRDSLAMLEAAAADTAAADTAAVPLPPPAPEPEPAEIGEDEPEEPLRLPDRRLYAIARVRIPVGTHIVSAEDIINLSGLVGGGEAEFEPLPPETEEEPPEQPPPD